MNKVYNSCIERHILNKVYETSQAMMRQTIDSARSRTLEELYTDEFRPQITKANKTCVKSLSTGKPVPAKISYIIQEGDIEGSHRRKYILKKEDNNKTLGKKSFGIVNNNDEKLFTPGVIKSYDNNHYAGTQIRLLQAAIELAQKNNINTIPLVALFPALKFHTMMGFRPSIERSAKVETMNDLKKNLISFNNMYRNKISSEDVMPVLSKVDGELYFDRNRTAFCAVIKGNERELERSHKRNLKLSILNGDYDINMVLRGEELNKWQQRIKGFEIIPDIEQGPDKYNFSQRLKDFFTFYD